MKILTLFVFLFPFFSCAQLQVLLSGRSTLPSKESPWDNYPTNITGYPAYTWFVAHGHFGDARWTNLSGTVGLDLTNEIVGAVPSLQTNVINSRDALLFDGIDDYLSCVNYTSAQPHEVWMVLCDTNNGSGKYYFDCDSFTPTRQYLRNSIYSGYYLNGGAGISATNSLVTNSWFILSVVLNGGSSAIFSNNVEIASGNTGANVVGGLVVGNRYTKDTGVNMLLAEMVTFQTNLNSISRSNLTYAWRNKYAISF